MHASLVALSIQVSPMRTRTRATRRAPTSASAWQRPRPRQPPLHSPSRRKRRSVPRRTHGAVRGSARGGRRPKQRRAWHNSGAGRGAVCVCVCVCVWQREGICVCVGVCVGVSHSMCLSLVRALFRARWLSCPLYPLHRWRWSALPDAHTHIGTASAARPRRSASCCSRS